MPIDNISSSHAITTHIDLAENSAQTQSSSQVQQQSSPRTQQPLRLNTSIPESENAPAYRRLIAADVEEISNALVRHLNNRCREAVDRINHRWSGASINKTQLKNFINARNTLNTHVITPLSKYPRDNSTDKINTNTILSIEDTGNISRAFEMAAQELPRGEVRELTGLLGQHINAVWKQMKTDEIKAKTIEELKSFRNPETFKTNTFSLEGRLGLGSPVIEVNNIQAVPVSASVPVDFGLSKKYELYTDPEGLVFLNKYTKKSFSVGGNAKAEVTAAVRAHVEGAVKVSKSNVKLEMFNSIEDLVEKKGYTRQIAKGNRNEYNGIPKPGNWNKVKQIFRESIDNKRTPTFSELANLKEDQQHATDNRKRLDELLKNVLKLHNSDINAPPPDRGRALAGHSSTVTASINARGGAGMTAIGINGDVNVAVSRSLFDFHLYAPSQFTEVIQKNAKRLDELPAKLMRHANESIQHTQGNTPERQKAAELKLRDLNTDLKRYYNVVKELDGLRNRQTTKIAKKDNTKENELVSEKHQIENKWYTIGRHNFLQTLSASHALLSINAIPPGKEHSDEAKNAVIDAADTLNNPDIRYDKKRLNKAATFKKDIILQYRNTKITASGSIEAYGQSGSLAYTREWSHRIHPSRVRQGKYINKTWTATGSFSANAPINALVTHLQGTASTVATNGDTSMSEGQTNTSSTLSDILDENSTNTNYSHLRSRITREFLPEFRQSPDYNGSKEYHTQFTRTTKTSTYTGKLGGTGPALPGFNIGVSADYENSKSSMTGQTLGTNDLSFVFNILNRMDKNRTTSPNAPNQFFEEHKVEFSEMFKKMGDPSTGIHHETQFFLNELIERAPESKKSEAYNALNIVFNGEKQPSKKDAALSTLEVITSRTSTDEEKDRAEETLKEAINSIPWSKIKEATPPKSTLATLGFGGIRVFNKKIIPGERLSTKFDKAEKAFNTIVEARGADASDTKSTRKVAKKQQDAIKTLKKLFENLDAESEYGKAKNTLSTLIQKAPPESEEYKNAKDCLRSLVDPEEADNSNPDLFDRNRIKERNKNTLIDFINAHTDTVSGKDTARKFAESFNRAMSNFKRDPSPANLDRAKSMFFDFHKQQMLPWDEAHKSTWKDIPFTRKEADSALNLGTRILKRMGIHPRIKEQHREQLRQPQRSRRMTKITPVHTAQGSRGEESSDGWPEWPNGSEDIESSGHDNQSQFDVGHLNLD